MSLPDLLVVILNYATRDLLRDCLRSLEAQRGLSFDVCVVDNDSPDGSAEMVEREFTQVHLLRNPENNGFSAGNNLGLRSYGWPQAARASRSDPVRRRASSSRRRLRGTTCSSRIAMNP